MSMCFLYKDVLYADCFQIHDFKDFAPSLTDNKIFVSESGKVVIAIMGNVPENIPDILDSNLVVSYGDFDDLPD